MSVVYVAERAVKISPTAATSTEVIPIQSNCTPGACLVLHTALGASTTVNSVTDTKGNAWTVRTQGFPTASPRMAVTMQNVGALTTSDTVTITYASNPPTSRLSQIEEFSGVASAVLDASATHPSSGTPTTATTGTATPTVVNDLAVATFCVMSVGACTLNGAGGVGTYSAYTTPSLADGTFQMVSCYQTGCTTAAQQSAITTPAAADGGMLLLLKAAIQIAGADTGSGSDAASPAHSALSGPDSGLGAESSTQLAALGSGDLSTALESAQLLANSASADTGTSLESSTTALTSADGASALESSIQLARVASADAGSALESSTTALTSADAGSGLESSQLAASSSSGDSAASAENNGMAASVAATDTAVSAEMSQAQVGLSGADSGGSSEASALQAAPQAGDSAASAENTVLQVATTGSDSGSAAETQALSVAVSSADTGAGTDSQAAPFLIQPLTIWTLTIPAGSTIGMFEHLGIPVFAATANFASLPNSGGLYLVSGYAEDGAYFPLDTLPLPIRQEIYIRSTLNYTFSFVVRLLASL